VSAGTPTTTTAVAAPRAPAPSYAAHQAVDALGLVTALIALRVAQTPASDDYTYGRAKSDALGGLVSALLLLASVGWIVWESIQRLVDPSPSASTVPACCWSAMVTATRRCRSGRHGST